MHLKPIHLLTLDETVIPDEANTSIRKNIENKQLYELRTSVPLKYFVP